MNSRIFLPIADDKLHNAARRIGMMITPPSTPLERLRVQLSSRLDEASIEFPQRESPTEQHAAEQ
ncbi:hypothetical protein EEB13_03070 [Rhodococcus sp. WS3]|nr:hypothetical protein EEB13_03070 [Rhodococcus sp. WS3]